MDREVEITGVRAGRCPPDSVDPRHILRLLWSDVVTERKLAVF